MPGWILKNSSLEPQPTAGKGTSSQSGASYTYASSDGDVVICTNTAEQTITLPAAGSAANAVVTFCDGNGGWSDNATIIIPNGSETIDGGNSVTCDTNNGQTSLVSNGTAWFVTAGDYSAYTKASSLTFDGVDDYVDLGNVNSLTGNFSLAIWIRPTSVTGAYQTSVGKRVSASGGCNYEIAIDTTSAKFSWYSENLAAGNDYVQSSQVLANDTWYHLVVTLAGTTLNMYANGSNVKTDHTLGNAVVVNSGSLAFGRAGSYDAEYFPGQILQVATWESTLTSGNVTTLYNSGVPVDPKRVSNGTLTGAWLMGDGSESGKGSIIYDGSVNNNNADFKNGTAFSTTVP